MSFFKHGDLLTSLDGLRSVKVVRSNPAGGMPRSDGGIVTYEDGQRLDVSKDFAEALTGALKTKTVGN